MTLAPDLPASIEWTPFPAPAVVVGDTLRTEAGGVARVRAIVRNTAGDTLTGAVATYLYADFNRDSALLVDSTGLVRAVKKPRGDARLAARAGASLQVLRPLVVTGRPDSAAGTGPSALLVLNPADTGRTAAGANTSGTLSVTVRTLASATSVEPVTGWLVRYEVLRPANPANDTTRGAWLVDDNGRPTAVDTTDTGGNASRKVRVRPSVFPGAAGTDTVVVQAVVRYRGVPVRGAPVRLVVPVQRR
ncbi:MAG: hypothetical protein KJT01_05375 [Gemmatimonadetes bacterium]|nr:hypothetical protein [Gemmatimonadota bacterium]